MKKPYKILIVENEPLIIYSLEKALAKVSNFNIHLDFKITIINDYKSASSKIEINTQERFFDLVILNVDISSNTKNEVLFAEDLVFKFKTLNSSMKIIALTSKNDSYRIYNIMQAFSPESLLLKREIDFNILVKAIKNILNDTPHYSKTILRLIRSHMANAFTLDKTDRTILYYLSKGLKTRELTELVFLSIGAIERRKRQLKDIFNISERGDRLLIEHAREHGYI